MAAGRGAATTSVVRDFIHSLAGVSGAGEILSRLDVVNTALSKDGPGFTLDQAIALLESSVANSPLRACEPGILGGGPQVLYRTASRPFRYLAVVIPTFPGLAQTTTYLFCKIYSLSRSYEYTDLIVRDLARLDAVRVVADAAASDALLSVGCSAAKIIRLDTHTASHLLMSGSAFFRTQI